MSHTISYHRAVAEYAELQAFMALRDFIHASDEPHFLEEGELVAAARDARRGQAMLFNAEHAEVLERACGVEAVESLARSCNLTAYSRLDFLY